MTHVVTDECVKCKYTECVEVCPVDCFYEGPDMLVIDPQSCIDCGVCISECPVNAIKPESSELLVWIERAKILSSRWPNIVKIKNPPPLADDFKNQKNKFEKYCQEEYDQMVRGAKK
jgi:ferredoxin